MEQKLSLAAVIAHEMDGIKGCGGTLAKYSQMGHRTVTIMLGKGNAGGSGAEAYHTIGTELIALDSGIDVKFMDTHIGVGKYPRAREIVSNVINEIADKHGLIFEAPRKLKLGPVGYYTQPIEGRIEHVKKKLLEEGPDLRMMLAHPGTHCPELSALQSKNPVVHCKDQGRNRGADTDTLCDPTLREFIDQHGIQLVGLREMIEERLQGELRPQPSTV